MVSDQGLKSLTVVCYAALSSQQCYKENSDSLLAPRGIATFPVVAALFLNPIPLK